MSAGDLCSAPFILADEPLFQGEKVACLSFPLARDQDLACKTPDYRDYWKTQDCVERNLLAPMFTVGRVCCTDEAIVNCMEFLGKGAFALSHSNRHAFC